MVSEQYKKIPCKRQLAEDRGLSDNSFPRSVRHDNVSIDKQEMQGIDELIVRELVDKFKPKHLGSERISAMYGEIGWQSKSDKVNGCGTFLDWVRTLDNDGVVSDRAWLTQANFCRDRFCPMCAWRRSLKLFSQMCQVMTVLSDNYTYLLLTLTVPSVSGEQLGAEISHLMKSWHAFVDYKKVSCVVQGFFRALEVTRNKKTGLYHPHFHVILAVNKSYLSSRDYLTHDKWLNLWRKAAKDDSITQIDIRVAHARRAGSAANAADPAATVADIGIKSVVLEVAKYVTKDTDIADSGVLRDLSNALYHRRLVQYGGVFRDAFDKLGLEDTESDGADLVGLDGVRPDADLLWIHQWLSWNNGNYQLAREWMETPEERKMRNGSD